MKNHIFPIVLLIAYGIFCFLTGVDFAKKAAAETTTEQRLQQIEESLK